jgi:small conductance mechanosensitive channel
MTSLSNPPQCDAGDQLCNAVLDATQNEWLAAAADWLIAKPLVVAWIILLGFLLRWVAHKLIGRLLTRAVGGSFSPVRWSRRNGEAERQATLAAERRRQRAETLGSVLRSVASFVVFTIVAMMSLAELGMNIGPLIASAGIAGVALGFGAQNLVRDFLSGLFMFFEDQCGVGDTVIIGDTQGVVEAIALRITRVRAEDGTIWYLRNGEILKVGNVSQRGTLPPGGGFTAPPEELPAG